MISLGLAWFCNYSRGLENSLRPYRAFIQLVDFYTGRCPVLFLMPLQGINLNA
jgi:hypothetical protein